MSLDSQIANYYEKLVVEDLLKRPEARSLDEDTLADIACLALSNLPARYYRHSVDMAFFLTVSALAKMEDETREAVTDAVNRVTSGSRDAD